MLKSASIGGRRGKEERKQMRKREMIICQCSLEVTHSASVQKQEWDGESV